MESTLWYLAKSTAASGIFIGFYYLMLRKESFFNLNRFFLIFSIGFAYLFPFIHLSFTYQDESSVEMIRQFQSTINQFNITNNMQPEFENIQTHSQQINWWLVLLVIISFVLLIRFIIHLFQIFKFIYAHEKITHRKFTLVLFNRQFTFSFFRYIFISQHVWGSPESNCIIDHELSHIKRKHSLDRLFIELLQIVFWMNPFIYLYRKALEEVHEFQADKDATDKNDSISEYFNLVLKQSAQQNYSPLMSPFSYQLIKKRIKMATYKSKPAKRFLIIAPIILAAVLILASATIQQVQSISTDIQNIEWPKDNNAENILISDHTKAASNTFYKNLEERESLTAPNTLVVLMNYKGTILLNGNKTTMSKVSDQVSAFYNNPSLTKSTIDIPLIGKQEVSDIYIFLKKDKSTSAENANALMQKVTSGIINLRNKAAFEHFKKSFYECSKEQQNAIVTLIPMQIVVSPPKSMKANQKHSTSFISPIKKNDLKRKGSGFGYRIHPIYKDKRLHSRIDYIAPKGAAILAIGDGVVRKAEANPNEEGYGKFIIIDHENGLSSLYAHVNAYNVKEGQKVKQGDVIAFVGNTGMSKGPHLHLEVKKDGEYINPDKVIKSDG